MEASKKEEAEKTKQEEGAKANEKEEEEKLELAKEEEATKKREQAAKKEEEAEKSKMEEELKFLKSEEHGKREEEKSKQAAEEREKRKKADEATALSRARMMSNFYALGSLAIIFLLVLAGYPAGVGFLIAAKSILRFDKDPKASEYVIIGTRASFGWALLVSFATLSLITFYGIDPTPS